MDSARTCVTEEEEDERAGLGWASEAGCAADLVLVVLEERVCQRRLPMFKIRGVRVGTSNRTGQPSEEEPCRAAADLLCDLGVPYPVCSVSPLCSGEGASLEGLVGLSWLWACPKVSQATPDLPQLEWGGMEASGLRPSML